MVPRLLLITISCFMVACGGAQSKNGAAAGTNSEARPASVIHETDAPQAAPPSQKAKITHLAEGQNAYVGKLWLAPGGKVPLHRDPTEEYLYVVSGGGELTMNGKTYILKSGHTVYMPAGAEVSFQNGPEPLVVLQVFADPDSAKKYGKWGAVQQESPVPAKAPSNP